MSSGHDRRIESAFLRARELPVSDRSAFLAGLFREEPHLIQRVVRLLDASTEADDYFADLARRAGALSSATLHHEVPGSSRVLGAYRLLEVIGHGGMGTVYRGQRADEAFEKQVAIKVLPPGMGTAALRARFEAERQILAGLEHPGISRLLDGGITDDGTPYFVMEYVEGEPIDEYCRSRVLDLDVRIDLFLEVCEAVEFAHRNLVVHRDLKPDNILVDEDGRVRLLDFGIAKVLVPEVGGLPGPDLTRPGGSILTPAFGSPEQIRGGTVTTATDVYALGLLLHLLFTDRRAYDLSGMSAAEREEVVCRIDPPLPSRTAMEGGNARLARRLEGDLDAIVMTAVAKDPDRRYAVVRGLAEDLRRAGSGHPISARPHTSLYRASRFVQRNRAWVGAGATITLLLVALTGTAVHSARTSAAQADVVALERDRAQAEAEKAERLVGFLVNAFEQANPAGTEGVERTARQILEAGAVRAREELTDQPELQAELFAALAEIYRGLGLERRGLSFAEEALAIREVQPDVADHDVFDLRYLVGRLSRGNEAIAGFRKLLPDVESRFASDLHGQASFLATYGEALAWSVDPEEKRETFEDAITLLRTAEASEEGDLALAQTLTRSTYGSGNPMPREEQVVRVQEALEIRRRILGEEHGVVATTLSDLALLHERSDPVVADTLMRRAADIHRKWAGESHTVTITLINNLAGIKRDRGDLAAAEPLYREALLLRELYQPGDRTRLAYSEFGLGVVLIGLGRPAEAVPFLRRVAETFPESDMRGRLAREHLAQALAAADGE
jgi:eukaryotic-like serine/threonine-protein kinase